MKKTVLIFILIIFVLFGVSSVFGVSKFTLPKGEKMYFSKLDKEFMESADEKGRVIVIKQFGKDKIEMQFPSKPELAYEKKGDREVFTYSAEEDGAEYRLCILDAFDEISYMRDLKDLKLDEGTSDFGSYIDLTYKIKDEICKDRILFCGLKIFHFQTKNTYPDEHEDFIHSFSVIKNLPS